MPSGEAAEPMRTMLEERSLILTMGPGGVGKTTIAAALGLGASHGLGRSATVLTVDPARRLGAVLGVEADAGPVEIAVPAGGRHGGRLAIEMIDPATAWDDLVGRELDAGDAARLRRNAMYRAVTRQFVQSHDFIAVERLFQLLGDEGETVVVDTPPSIRGLDFLASPARMTSFLTLRSLSWFTGTTSGPVTELASRPFRAVADRVLGKGFVADLSEFFGLAGGLVEGLLHRAERVQAALDRAGVVMVSSPEGGPLAQARSLGMSLDGPTWCASVVNLVAGEVALPVMDEATLVEEVVRVLGGSDDDRGIAGTVRRALDRLHDDARAAAAGAARVMDAFGGSDTPPWVPVLRKDEPPSSAVALVRIAEELGLEPT